MGSKRADRQRTGILLVLLTVVVAALGACGGTGSTSITTLGHEPAAPQQDLAAAQRVVLSTVDLPGYRAEPGAEPDTTSAQAAANFQQCAGAGAAGLGDDQRTAQSPAFRMGTSTSISSLAVIALDEEAARTTMTDLGKAQLEPCVTGLLRAVLESDLKLPVAGATSELLPHTGAGDQSITWRTTVQFTSSGQTLTAYSDLTFVRSGRALATLFDFQTGEPFPSTERLRLVSLMVNRMRDICWTGRCLPYPISARPPFSVTDPRRAPTMR